MLSLENILTNSKIEKMVYKYDNENMREWIDVTFSLKNHHSVTEKINEGNRFDMFLNYLGLDTTENKDEDFNKLKELLLMPYNEKEAPEERLLGFKVDRSIFDIKNDPREWIEDYLDTYNTLVDNFPSLIFLCPYIISLTKYMAERYGLYSYEEFSDDELLDYIEPSSKELCQATAVYADFHNIVSYLIYIRLDLKYDAENIFYIPQFHEIKMPTSEISIIYQAYCQETFGQTVFSRLNPFIYDKDHELLPSWEDVVIKLPTNLHEEIKLPECNNIYSFLQQSMEYMVNEEMCIRKCKHCKRYFVTRYSSLAEYCERLVEGTNANCQEYHSKKRYKNKKAKDPLYQTYIKYYNRIYGRIRRKSLPEDSPLLDEIKTLYSNYDDRFKLAETDDIRHEILDEFIVEAEKLIKG